MLILDRGVWVKFEDDGKLEDGIIDNVFWSGSGYDKPIGYSVFCKNHMNGPIVICADRIKFVKLNDLDGETYYANYRILNENVDWQGKYINPGTKFGKTYYNELCTHDAIRGNMVSYKAYYCKYDKNALKGAINKMYGILAKDMNYNPIDYTKYNPKQVLLNGTYTTVVWEDGSHTVVKLAKGEVFDPEKAILYAIVKHICGDVKAEMDRYLNRFDEVSIYKFKSKKEFLKELDERDAAGDICQEYNPDEDEEYGNDTE